ncbi:MAG: thiamine pyrophosphate-binding protein [Dongiaceae bacterium]
MLSVESAALALGLRGIDVRHEQAAAIAAHAYARLRNRPACMAASGPGTANLVTGMAHAFVDCTPVLALGGSRRSRRAISAPSRRSTSWR